MIRLKDRDQNNTPPICERCAHAYPNFQLKKYCCSVFSQGGTVWFSSCYKFENAWYDVFKDPDYKPFFKDKKIRKKFMHFAKAIGIIPCRFDDGSLMHSIEGKIKIMTGIYSDTKTSEEWTELEERINAWLDRHCGTSCRFYLV